MVFTSKIELKPHQKTAIQFCMENSNALISYAPGLGKSLISIAVGFKLLKRDYLDKMIYVVTKSSLIEVQGEFRRFTDVDPVICDSGDKFINFLESSQKICLIQYNWVEKFFFDRVSVQLTKDKVLNRSYSKSRGSKIEELLSRLRCGLSLDEVHQVKNPKSNMSKVLLEFRKFFRRIYGYTGTPITRNLDDLYHVVNFIKEGLLGPYINFRYRYMEIEQVSIGRGRKIPKIIGYRNLSELNSRLSGVVLTYFPKSNIVYDKREFEIKDVNSYMLAAKGVLGVSEGSPREYSSRLIDLQYVVNRDEGKKIEFLKVLDETLNKGIIVYCAFYESVKIVQEILDNRNIPNRLICGRDESEERKMERDWFNQSPEGKVLIITSAGSESINLQSTSNFLFFDIPFGIGKFIQSLGRIVRMNSKFNEFHILFLIAKDCIDEYKYEYLSQNKELMEKVLRNEVMPKSDSFPKYNDYILRQLKRSYLWKTQRLRK